MEFRTNRPTFEPGDEHTAFVTGTDNGTPLIRVGDTILRLEGAAVPVDAEVQFRISRFDDETSTGVAEVVEVIADPD
jgi:cation transport ATPase